MAGGVYGGVFGGGETMTIKLNRGREIDPGMYVIENIEVEQDVAAKFLGQLSPEGKILLRKMTRAEGHRRCASLVKIYDHHHKTNK